MACAGIRLLVYEPAAAAWLLVRSMQAAVCAALLVVRNPSRAANVVSRALPWSGGGVLVRWRPRTQANRCVTGSGDGECTMWLCETLKTMAGLGKVRDFG